MVRILFLMILPFVCFSQITPREDILVNSVLKEKENLDTKRKASFNLDEIKVRWKKAALENCPGVPCIVTPPAPSFTCASTVTDVDNNIYNIVAIGTGATTQCWTKTNLRVTKYNDGTSIILDANQTSPTDGTSLTWQNRLAGAYTIYDNESSTGANATNYGFLYNWYAVKGIATAGITTYKNICPSGWHVPTDAEWTTLTTYLNTVAPTGSVGGKMKSTGDNTAGTGLWNSPNTGADNSSGFSALPGGFRNFDGSFYEVRVTAFFWSATESGSNAWYRNLNDGNGDVDRNDLYIKSLGASVRCLRD
jgi:uncharacterized protein (TIGR02145 family)